MARATSSPAQGRELLIEVGRRLFLAHGYADVSMQAIAQEAGMTKGAPYYHFASKQDLFVQVSLDIMATLLRTCEAALAADGPFQLRVRQSILDVVHAISGDFSRWYSDLVRMDHDSVMHGAMKTEFGVATPHALLIPIFERARSEGAYTRVDARTATTMYFVLIKTAIDRADLRQQDPFHEMMELDDLVEVMVDIYFNGIH
jgi:AcrR family transcriptional regulator